MLDAASFFAKFKGRGLLYETTWTPAGGGAGGSFEARLMRGGPANIPMVGAEEKAIQFITTEGGAIAQGDTVTLGGTTYKLRDRDIDNCSADGTLTAYRIRET